MPVVVSLRMSCPLTPTRRSPRSLPSREYLFIVVARDNSAFTSSFVVVTSLKKRPPVEGHQLLKLTSSRSIVTSPARRQVAIREMTVACRAVSRSASSSPRESVSLGVSAPCRLSRPGFSTTLSQRGSSDKGSEIIRSYPPYDRSTAPQSRAAPVFVDSEGGEVVPALLCPNIVDREVEQKSLSGSPLCRKDCPRVM